MHFGIFDIQRSVVIVTAVRVTIGYSDNFLVQRNDLLIMKIFR